MVMAVTGLMFFGYVVGHLAGNLKVFTGREKFNAYAEFLREVGAPVFGHSELLWIARAGLLVALVLHITAAIQLWQPRTIAWMSSTDTSIASARKLR